MESAPTSWSGIWPPELPEWCIKSGCDKFYASPLSRGSRPRNRSNERSLAGFRMFRLRMSGRPVAANTRLQFPRNADNGRRRSLGLDAHHHPKFRGSVPIVRLVTKFARARPAYISRDQCQTGVTVSSAAGALGRGQPTKCDAVWTEDRPRTAAIADGVDVVMRDVTAEVDEFSSQSRDNVSVATARSSIVSATLIRSSERAGFPNSWRTANGRDSPRRWSKHTATKNSSDYLRRQTPRIGLRSSSLSGPDAVNAKYSLLVKRLEVSEPFTQSGEATIRGQLLQLLLAIPLGFLEGGCQIGM